ncbi:MAG: thioredoxin-disulfide reductase, partial [Lentisphaeria bacterium]|nr:thioredoxin-disulfide reductase [Lentisphaeria bacterium]
MEKLIIIGCGAAGMTAALYAGRASLNPLVLAGPLPGGLLTQTSDVENYPGFPEAVNGFELMSKFQQQAEKFGARIEYEKVEKADLKPGGPQKLTLEGGQELECQALIIATGASPRWLGLESEKKFLNKGVSACATCDGAFYRNVPVTVVGGGDSAMEEANFLTHFASEVHLVHRRDAFRASKIMVDRAKNNPKIKFHLNSNVTEIVGSEDVEGVIIRNSATGEQSRIDCKAYFAALGHVPSTAMFKGVLEMNGAGYLTLQGASSRTSMEGVFAAGDCADPVYRQAI